jgi:hypothetical protein
MPADRRAPLTDFETGGLLSRSDGIWSTQLQDWLTSIAASNAVLICVEDGLDRPSDPVVRDLNHSAFFYEDSVLSYGPPDSNELARLLGGATWNPTVAIVTEISGKQLPDRDYVDQRVLIHLAANATAVVIGAWDDEGLVVWEPALAG